MAERVIRVNASRRAVLDIIRRAPHVAVGGSQPAKQLLVRMGLTALSFIKQAFIVKARGGTDAAGLKWVPLDEKTVAYSRRHPGVLFPGKKRAPFAPSWMLTKAQRTRWWKLYRQFGGIGPKGRQYHARTTKPSMAAARAWIILKAEGAKTLLMVYGKTPVEILRSSGLLFNSLSPGIPVPAEASPPAAPPKMPNQVFRLERGSVIVGTNRKWAIVHHEGKGNNPQRRLWAKPSDWPQAWWDQITIQGQYGLIDIIVAQLGGNP